MYLNYHYLLVHILSDNVSLHHVGKDSSSAKIEEPKKNSINSPGKNIIAIEIVIYATYILL